MGGQSVFFFFQLLNFIFMKVTQLVGSIGLSTTPQTSSVASSKG